MIYSIGDLHLDYTKKKSMDVFGSTWENYEDRIFTQWKEIIQEDDIVLVPGDISWQMSLSDAYYDLVRIDALPGTKIMIRGNHDYWWSSISKIRNMGFRTISFLQNDSIELEDYNICGTRGWLDPTHKEFLADQKNVFDRELLRCEMSLKSVNNTKEIIFMIHYPPFDAQKKRNRFGELFEKYPVTLVNYGHLHAKGHKNIVEGMIEGIEYRCTSSDYIDFKPIRLR